MQNLNSRNLPIILAISGASGTIYGFRTLHFLLQNNYNVDLVISKNTSKVAITELNLALSSNPTVLKEQVLSYLSLKSFSSNLNVWSHDDISATFSSGSYLTKGMMIVPASMGTVGAIASGLANNLIARSADVCLKERRKLVIVPREMPFNSIHLENLLRLSQCGAIIAPASPAFYNNPETLSDSIDFVVGKVLDLFDIDNDLFVRWRSQNKISSYAPIS